MEASLIDRQQRCLATLELHEDEPNEFAGHVVAQHSPDGAPADLRYPPAEDSDGGATQLWLTTSDGSDPRPVGSVRTLRRASETLIYVTTESAGPPDTSADSATMVGLRATVTRVELEGGFFGLITDAGERLEPDAIPLALQRDGAPVLIDARPGDPVSSRMWGMPVRLTAIRELDGETE